MRVCAQWIVGWVCKQRVSLASERHFKRNTMPPGVADFRSMSGALAPAGCAPFAALISSEMPGAGPEMAA